MIDANREKSIDNLAKFAAIVENARTDAACEKMVRGMLEANAKSCPVEVLYKLGKCIVECRYDELLIDGLFEG